MLSPKPWRVEYVIFFGIALFTSVCIGALICGVLHKLHVPGFVQMDGFGNIFVGTFTFQGLAWPLGWIFLKLHRIPLTEALGLRDRRIGLTLFIALIVFAFVLPTVWLLQMLSVNTLTRLGWPPESQAAVQLLRNVTSWWSRGYLAVFAAVLAPVAEEFIFRGILYPFIKRLGWPKLAFISTSFLFALIHFDAGTFLPLFALALVLTWLYEFTDVLVAPILVHMLFNTANLVMLVLQHLGYISAP